MIVYLIHSAICIAVAIRVIMRRPATGVALGWIVLVIAIPFVGVIGYLLFGERRISQQRAKRIAALRMDYDRLSDLAISDGMADVDWDKHDPDARAMNRLGVNMIGMPTVTGSTGQLYSNTQEILKQLAEDVDQAKKSVLMEFYIWHEGGSADDVLEALIRAASRGVQVRLLVDALGGHAWWRSAQPDRLRDAGVHLHHALPAGFLRLVTGRNDLRLHRKIVVIDGELAWTGSMNLVDPRYFKQDAHVGEWVDAMVRTEGCVVVPLALTMIGDWALETGEKVDDLIDGAGLKLVAPHGDADVQVIPTGPGETDDGLLQMLLGIINSAQEELVLTSPYFVPDDALLRAIRGAGNRGVKVRMILPEKVDSMFARYACHSYYDELMDAGVEIHLYDKGLLHTKSITADRRISMFGTANLDMRSIWLNYEVSLFVYDRGFGTSLRELQQTYIDDATRLDTNTWASRPRRQQFLENTFRLIGPLL